MTRDTPQGHHAPVNPRTRKLVLLLVVVLAFLMLAPHGVLHHETDGGCSMCFVQALQVPEPVQVEEVVHLVTRVSRAEATPATRVVVAPAEPRAPPEKA